MFCLEVIIYKRSQMWRHNDAIGRNEYLIFTLSESTIPYVHSLQFVFKSTHQAWRYERKCEWVLFSEHSVEIQVSKCLHSSIGQKQLYKTILLRILTWTNRNSNRNINTEINSGYKRTFFQQNPIAWPLSSFCVTWGENLESSITPSWTSVPTSQLFKCSFVNHCLFMFV